MTFHRDYTPDGNTTNGYGSRRSEDTNSGAQRKYFFGIMWEQESVGFKVT